MNEFLSWTARVGRVVWKHTSAFVAVLLILAALVIGSRIGRPALAPDDDGGVATDTTLVSDGKAQMYTCSMHPSVRLPDPDAKCPICFMDLIPVTDGGGEGNERQLVLTEASAKLSEIETAKVGRFLPTARVRLYGKLTYDQTSIARISAQFPGRLDRLFVNYVGVPVAKGDHLAEMYSPQLLAAFEELRQARLAVDGTVTTSDIVRDSTERTLEAARERLGLLGLTEEQIAGAEAGEASGERLTIYSPIAGIVINLAAREGDYVETGSPIVTVADLSRLWLDMEAYESQLPLLRWGQPVTFTVEANPGKRFEGRIAFIEPIVDERTRTTAVRVAVDNSDRELKPGMFATATVRPRVASGGAVVSDELAGRWVSPMHPTVVRDSPGQCDICGMDLVSAESLGVVGDPSAVEEPLVIPRTAAMLTGTRAIVYIKAPDTERPTYEAREVVLGPRAGEFYIVESGLREGEEVVVKGAFRIDSAMQIAAKPSMMMPQGGGGGAAHQHAGHTPEMPATETSVTVPDSFVFSLKPVYVSYLDAQESLASDDLSGFTQTASDLNTAIGFVEEVGLAGEPLDEWRRAVGKLRRDRPVTTIDDARARFERMSEAVIALQRRFGHQGGETWHVAYCPMAFGNKGAEWLQRGTTIDNPYFGASMLRCGEIRSARLPLSQPAGDAAGQHEGHDHD
ncbi:MAG: efflux RND transporter periplasmic adaptor subunit [Phycisphaerales bacterium]|nr:efflux RND transporter periplasmic adaptor subunit [Phycisphaerales bacterium]